MPLTRLWQRIFLYSLLLVLLSLVMGVILHSLEFAHRRNGMALAISGEIGRTLDGNSLELARTLLQVFNNRPHKHWLENADGELVGGMRHNGLSGAAWRRHLSKPEQAYGVTLWQTDVADLRSLAESQVKVDGLEMTLFSLFAPPPSPPLHTFLLQWLLTTALIGGLLSLWMSRRVSLPLRRLEEELAELQKSRSFGQVTVSGKDEIAAVATALNQLMDSLKRHVEGMRGLVVNISHELRSPLARMSLSADLIREGLFLHPLPRGKGAMSEEALQQEASVLLAKKHSLALQEELELMEKLIGVTLLSSKLDLREPESLTARVDLSRLCLNAAYRHEALYKRAGLCFDYEKITPDIAVVGDVTLLLQLISNLLDNALKYSSQNEGRVRMELVRDGHNALLYVENPCGSLPSEVLAHIFEPFFRYEQNTGTGTGLGLSLVEKIATLHRGGVTAASSGQGLRFSVTLPLAPAQEAADTQPPPLPGDAP